MTNDVEIEIEYRPINKIVILELTEFTNNELFERVAATRISGVNLPLHWAEGIVFIAIPVSPEITGVGEHLMEGTVYFSGVTYSQMDQYRKMVQVGADKIPIIDQSKSKTFKAIATWIQQRTKA